MNNKNGFTLIEIAVGLVLLAIGLLAVAAMQISSVRGNFFSSSLTQASVLGQDRLEGLRTLPITNPALNTGDHNDGAFQVAGASTIFLREYNVASGGGMLNITLTVRWNDGSNHSVSFSTVRAVPVP